MEIHDKINMIIENKLLKTSIKPIPKIQTFKELDIFVPTSRPEIHKGRMTIDDFNNYFEKLKENILTSENIIVPDDLTFYDKFKIAKLFNPIITVWGIACLFEPMNIDNEISVYWDYIINTRGDLGQAQSKRTRGPRLDDDVYTTTLNYKTFNTSNVIMSTFGKDILTSEDKNKLDVGFYDTYKIHHHLLNLYWK